MAHRSQKTRIDNCPTRFRSISTVHHIFRTERDKVEALTPVEPCQAKPKTTQFSATSALFLSCTDRPHPPICKGSLSEITSCSVTGRVCSCLRSSHYSDDRWSWATSTECVLANFTKQRPPFDRVTQDKKNTWGGGGKDVMEPPQCRCWGLKTPSEFSIVRHSPRSRMLVTRKVKPNGILRGHGQDLLSFHTSPHLWSVTLMRTLKTP